jgi:hypothetical protein
MHPQGPLELLSRDEGGVVILWRRSFLIQVRQGELKSSLYARVKPPVVECLDVGAAFGALLVVEAGAPIANDEVRQAQKQFMTDIASRPSMRIAAVMLGHDVQSTLHRSVGRLVAAGNPHVQRFETVASGAAWLAKELAPLGLSVKPNELVAMVEHVRQIPAAS